ncbi:MAG TPA: DNA-3-methyladenine glycosylase [Candidatus Saccharimonadales bacterium]|nr:DNA-3-methyladenine glycosylase [Candidatus Saccharimonadales bacterium]
MSKVLNKSEAERAAKYLTAADAVLAPIIAAAGPCTIRQHQNYYWELIDGIIGQQMSIKAAAAIERRFKELFGTETPQPEAIVEKSIDDLRSVGLSRAKASYIQDLAQHIIDGKLKFDNFESMSNDEIIQELVAVKGIGEWTAHMFLMFCMARTDILAVGDLGVRNAVKKLYGFDNIPTPDEVKLIAEQNNWHPYETAACWYLWKSSDNSPG